MMLITGFLENFMTAINWPQPVKSGFIHPFFAHQRLEVPFCPHSVCPAGVDVIKLPTTKWFWCWFKAEILAFIWDVGSGCFHIHDELHFHSVFLTTDHQSLIPDTSNPSHPVSSKETSYEWNVIHSLFCSVCIWKKKSLSVLRPKNKYLVCSDSFNLHCENNLGKVRKKSGSHANSDGKAPRSCSTIRQR